MRVRLALVLLCTLLCQTFSFAEEETVFKEKDLTLSSMMNPSIVEINKTFKDSIVDYVKDENISQIDIDTLLLKKGSKFYVKSLQPMSSDTPEGARVEFVTETNLFSDTQSSKLVFTGEVIENKPPRTMGRSSTLKLKIQKVKVDKVSYTASAFISRVGNKPVHNGIIAGVPIYLNNLATTADVGTVTMDKVYKDPCQYTCDSISTIARPFYYLGASLLQLTDLIFVAPVISLFKKGDTIEIPKDSSFEIKLARDMALLKI